MTRRASDPPILKLSGVRVGMVKPIPPSRRGDGKPFEVELLAPGGVSFVLPIDAVEAEDFQRAERLDRPLILSLSVDRR